MLQLKEAVESGDSVTALTIVNEALDVFRQSELQRCKTLAYARFRAGKCSYETYRELWELADGFQR